MISMIGAALGAAASLLFAMSSPEPASVETSDAQTLTDRGEQLYDRRCGACHSLDQNRVGPRHRGVYGRKAGAVSDFRYSKALKELDIVWNEETLNAWLADPTAFAPGTAMGFRLKDEEERKAIIAYLKSASTSLPGE